MPWGFLKFKDWVLFIYMLAHHPQKHWLSRTSCICLRFYIPKAVTTISPIPHLFQHSLTLHLHSCCTVSNNRMGAQRMPCGSQYRALEADFMSKFSSGSLHGQSLTTLGSPSQKEVTLREEATWKYSDCYVRETMPDTNVGCQEKPLLVKLGDGSSCYTLGTTTLHG